MDHPYAPFLLQLERPARYWAAEYGAVRKAWDAVDCRFCLAFPDTYELGMSHLGLKVLYEVMGAAPDLLCERVFAPWTDLEAELRSRRLPLVSLESARPLVDFDVLGFSLQHELTYTTILAMLELGGIAVRAADRAEHEPLVLGGGPVAAHPEPIAPFFDLFLVGEAEHALPELLRADATLRARGASRRDRIAELARRPEIYAPGLHPTTRDPASGRHVVGAQGAPVARRRWEPDLDPLPDTGGGPVPATEAVFDRAAIEVARGCNQGCRFCQAGFLYRPMRERSSQNVAAALARRAAEGGYDEVSLTALSTADYSGLQALLERAGPALRAGDLSLSVSSLRAIDLAPDVLDFLRTGRAGSLTFAPEAGSQRMRDRINKRISEAGLLQTAREVSARGWNHLKLYFMVGLPGETDEDVDAILELAERVRQAARGAAPGRAPRVTCAVNNLVPKPHTPMQWCAMASADALAHKQRRLRAHPLARRLGLRLHDIPMSLLEARLARGDRALAAVVEAAYRRGARFDGWQDQFRPDHWDTAWQEVGLDPRDYDRRLPVDGRLPWDHIDVGVLPSFFREEYERMARGRPGPPCGLPAERDYRPGVACLRCGLPCQSAPPPRAADSRPEPEDAASEASREARSPAHLVLPAPERLELRFSKRPPATALSHLDLVRHFPRILRRAGIHPAYTEGFNPRPRLVFAPPAPLGAEAEDDPCEVWVHAVPTRDPEALRARLEAAALGGVAFHGVRWVSPEEPPLAHRIAAVRYRFIPREPVDADALQARVQGLLRAPTFFVARRGKRRKGGPVERDVRSSILTVAVAHNDAPHAPAETADLVFVIRLGDGPSVRPSELLGALFGGAPPPGRLVREALEPAPPEAGPEPTPAGVPSPA